MQPIHVGTPLFTLLIGCTTPLTGSKIDTPDAAFMVANEPTISLSAAVVQRPTHDGKVVLFGNLHAHSKLSDDIRNVGSEMLPIRAFEASQDAGLDFIAISDHHQASDQPDRLAMTASEYETQLFDVAMQYNADHAGEFIAIPAIEWGVISQGNHINVFGAEELPPNSIGRHEYDELLAWAATDAEFVQFNHPASWKKKSTNSSIGNFGSARFPSFGAFVEVADPTVKTMSIICTVFGGHITGTFAESTNKTHRDVHSKHYGVYKSHLNKGLHISPAANQDTHRTNWGTVTAARTAVWADSASYDDLMDGFRANRVYATEDDEMVVVFQVEYDGKTYWMGETVPLDDEEADIEVIVKVWQAAGSDCDPIDEGPYTVAIFSDSDGIGGRAAAEWAVVEDIASEQEMRIPLQVVAGEYIFLRVTEEGGADNPEGDGDDEFDNATGAFGADGLRDDLNDSAWTTPVWFTLGADSSGGFVWSKNSGLFHDSDCWVVKQIGSANRREGDVAPAGKTKHDCHP